MKPSNMALAAQASHDLSFLLQCQYALHVHHPEECLNRWAIDDLESKLSDLAALLGYEIVKPEDVATPDDGWIEWGGKDDFPPIDAEELVKVRLSDGAISRSTLPACEWRWPHCSNAGDIIAYRIVKGGEA